MSPAGELRSRVDVNFQFGWNELQDFGLVMSDLFSLATATVAGLFFGDQLQLVAKVRKL